MSRPTETETLLALAKDCELYAKVIKGIIVVDNETCANERREPRATLLKAAAALRGLAQTPSGQSTAQLLVNLVDWTWIHATEGAHWPSAATTETLIRKAKERGPTQEDAGRYITDTSTLRSALPTERSCQCDSPVIRCDNRGCRCTICGELERLPVPNHREGEHQS